jgi:ABC-type transport system involved in cytochrome bd biosynthesis fused ATPase/permease subunit
MPIEQAKIRHDLTTSWLNSSTSIDVSLTPSPFLVSYFDCSLSLGSVLFLLLMATDTYKLLHHASSLVHPRRVLPTSKDDKTIFLMKRTTRQLLNRFENAKNLSYRRSLFTTAGDGRLTVKNFYARIPLLFTGLSISFACSPPYDFLNFDCMIRGR